MYAEVACMPVCPECGGELKFDRSRYMYICRSCGLSLTRFEYERTLEGKRKPQAKEDEREKLRKEYLRWWLGGKKGG
ncbi:MAG: hypothetical protein DRJ98_01205 [Thermoprotei archaeon]|nr:MAG: hypothetical protein DRJ98_01205 [Thermoprotei archaeon]